MPFPSIAELPAVLDSTGWTWEQYETPSFPSHSFWVGTDSDGRKWLTKLTGDFYAYREIVFARIAQKMGWSCQSSTFVILDDRSADCLGVCGGNVHAAHWFLVEHASTSCSRGCPWEACKGHVIDDLDDLNGCKVFRILDWPRSEIAAALFGGNEPPGRLITAAHEFVIIDSEQMFSTGPTDVTKTQWWNRHDGTASPSGRQMTFEVCRRVSQLSDNVLADALAKPSGVAINELWPIAPRLGQSRQFAHQFATDYERGWPID
jgi:hypothetical protein